MKGFTLRYDGRVTLPPNGGGETANGIENAFALPPGTARGVLRLTVEHTFAADGSAEIVRYRAKIAGERRSAAIYLDALSCAHILDEPPTLTVHPPEERGGFPTAGYLLTPGASRLFSRPLASGDAQAWGDGCTAGAKGCTDLWLPIHFNGKIYRGAWTPAAGSVVARPYEATGGGRVASELAWTAAPLRGKPYPRVVAYREADAGGLRAQAEYVLVRRTEIAAIPPRRSLVRPDSTYQIEKDHVGYGGPYDPNLRDERALYRRMEQGRKAPPAQSPTPRFGPWLGMGGSLLIIALLFALVLRKGWVG